ncbi:MAG: class IIb bacteriocin, lactobin A/cerein 7B family [Clostridiales bacterium]|nr:class IIb bacteriocin, lactobin A/cerein 7B family [Clostridiales bacterium]
MNEMMNYEVEMNDTELEDVNGGGILTTLAVYGTMVAVGYGVGWVTGKVMKKKSGVCYQ